MAVSNIFATQAAGPVPASYLDVDFTECALLASQNAFTNIQHIDKALADINTSTDLVRSYLGSFNPDDELSGPAGSFSNWAVVGATAIPAGVFTGISTWPSGGVAGYALTSNPSIAAVGVYGAGGIATGGAGAVVEGGNFAAINNTIQSGASNTGFDFTVLYAVEADVVIQAKAGPTAPTGAAAGFAAILNAEIAPVGNNLAAFLVSNVGSVPWAFGLATNSGTVTTGVSLGAVSGTGPVDSQNIALTALDGSSNPLLSQMFGDSVGNFVIINPLSSSLIMGGASTALEVRRTDAGNSSIFKVSNPTANVATRASFVLETGTASSNVVFGLTDGNVAQIDVAAGVVNGFAINVASGSLNITCELVTSASTTSRAGLKIIEGTAPTSPVNGDVWMTGSGLFYRAGGSTVGPLT